MKTRLLSTMAAFGVLTTPCLATALCPADLDATGSVDGADLAALLASWGATGGSADVDGDGVVGSGDLASMLAGWGACGAFDYADLPGTLEERRIAFEMLGPNGPLQPDASTINRVKADLDAIRTAQPELFGQTHDGAWDLTSILVKLDPAADASAYEYLNDALSATATPLFGDWYTLNFPGELNMVALAEEYRAAESVLAADPNFIVGGQNEWSPVALENGDWRWTIDDGFHDCTDGCDCHEIYVYLVAPGGGVTLLDFSQQGQSWCVFD